MASPGRLMSLTGRVAYEFAQAQPYIPMYIHLIISALFPIYAGAHASLGRPSSAAKTKRARARGADEDEESEADVDAVESRMERLSPSDAITFPLLAGSTLAGLYFLIKWLNDPALLNKILNWYFSAFGVFSISKLVTDALGVVHSFLFPKRYLHGEFIWRVNEDDELFIVNPNETSIIRKSPLPGPFGIIPLPRGLNTLIWGIRHFASQKLLVKAHVNTIGAVKLRLGIHGLIGIVTGLGAVVYYNFMSKPWWLTNLMGFGFCYGALQLMSPTTFWTGTLVEVALFFYDIYFVFFTPMMVTVAKSLDVPIKLLFPRPPAPGADAAIQQLAMLGLGDIVLPGIMIGLALRFDLYLFYLQKQRKMSKCDNTHESTSCDGVLSVGSASSMGTSEDASHLNYNLATEGDSRVHNLNGEVERPPKAEASYSQQHGTVLVKAPYRNVTGSWGERFWTSSWSPRNGDMHVELSAFPKTYFHASIAGYILGMLTTVVVMQITSSPQPALLYLVPGVVGSLWITALARGQLKEMWTFSESIEDEEQNHKKKAVGKSEDKVRRSKRQHASSSPNEDSPIREGRDYSGLTGEDENEAEGESRKSDSLEAELSTRDGQQEIVLFSITAPASRKSRNERTEIRAGRDQGSHTTNLSRSGSSSKGAKDGNVLTGQSSDRRLGQEPAWKRQKTA